MKTTFRTSFYAVSICFLFNPAFSQIETSQYDDIYFDGTETVIKKNKTDKQSLNSDNVEIFEDEYSETEVVEENSYKEEYIEDENYEPYEYEYASKVRRFHNSAPGFSYYSNYYVDNYWYDSYNPYYYGTSIYVTPNYGYYNGWGPSYYYGWNNHYNYHHQNQFGWNNWGWRSPNQGYGFYGYNNYGYGYNNWCPNYAYQSNNWGYNFASSSPNASNYVVDRNRRGSDVVRRSGAHSSSAPGGRMLAVSNNSNTINGGRTTAERSMVSSTNGKSGVRNKNSSMQSNTRRPDTYANNKESSTINTRNNSYTPRSNSGTRNTYTTPRNNNTYTPRSNSGTRNTYTPSRSSTPSKSESGSNRNNSSKGRSRGGR